MESEKIIEAMDEASALLEIESRMEPIVDSFNNSGSTDLDAFLQRKAFELSLDGLALAYQIAPNNELKSLFLKQFIEGSQELKKLY